MIQRKIELPVTKFMFSDIFKYQKIKIKILSIQKL